MPTRQDEFQMTTSFGKRRGWEIQKLRQRDRAVIYRLTERNSCVLASDAEIALWRLAKLPFGTDGDKDNKK